jgi:lipoprotein NlpI
MSRLLSLASAAFLLLGQIGLSLSAEEETPEVLIRRAQKLSSSGPSGEAVVALTKAIEIDPKEATAWYLRGRERFRLGQVRESVADFDKHVELAPALASRQWERGISLYYAGQFDKGAKQFELYQTYHDNDVENSVWRYLCMARSEGVEKAREAMLPIKNDPRVPMMQIYDLYRGKLKPEDVLRAAAAGDVPDSERNARLFYAHLYLGLYYEAAGEAKQAKTHIFEAADKHKIGHYMWDVAHIHAQQLRVKEVPQ